MDYGILMAKVVGEIGNSIYGHTGRQDPKHLNRPLRAMVPDRTGLVYRLSII